MQKTKHTYYEIFVPSTQYSLSQWLPFTLYEWLPKYPRYAPTPFLMNPITNFYNTIAWHSPYATVFPHSKRYRMLRAICTNDLKEVTTLLDQNFPIDAPIDPKYHYNALQIAATNNHYPLIEMLVLRGANIDGLDQWGNTSLMIAVNNHNYEAIHSLMRNGCDPNIKNRYGYTAVDKASGNPSIREFIMNYKEEKLKFPRFRVRLRLQEKLRAPFW